MKNKSKIIKNLKMLLTAIKYLAQKTNNRFKLSLVLKLSNKKLQVKNSSSLANPNRKINMLK
jgi:hypothetical protein